MKVLKILLLPLSWLYGLIMLLRNSLYDWGILKSTSIDIPIIGVGNLSVGGTGKTPTVEYLIRLAKQHGLRPAVISRGYGRKTRGYLLLSSKETAASVGDEPYQIKKKFPNVAIAVSENRVKGVRQLLKDEKAIDVIILDDSYQHRAIKPGINILLTDYTTPFTNRWLLPAGKLREGKNARKRADVIVVTKSPIVLSPFEERRLRDTIKPFDYQQLFFSYINYGRIEKAFAEATYRIDESSRTLKRHSVLLVTGIENPTPLKFHLERNFKEVFLMPFRDHHIYNKKDIGKINERFKNMYNPNKIIVTTEKDLRRMENSEFIEDLKVNPLFYVPIKFQFHNQKNPHFNELIINYIVEFNSKQKHDAGADRRNHRLHQAAH